MRDLEPAGERTIQALRNLAEAAGGYITCLIDGSNDMEARAAAYNRRYAKAHPARLCIDGHAYRRRRRTR